MKEGPPVHSSSLITRVHVVHSATHLVNRLILMGGRISLARGTQIVRPSRSLSSKPTARAPRYLASIDILRFGSEAQLVPSSGPRESGAGKAGNIGGSGWRAN